MTSYVGEVGLDFSTEGRLSKDLQLRAFRRVLETVQGRRKTLSLHSRGAEDVLLDLLGEYEAGPAVFHWYSGSLSVLRRLIEAGHYSSVKPAMVASARGRRIIEEIPRERVLTETDGPYVRVGGQLAQPADVVMVCRHLASVWGTELPDSARQVLRNMGVLIGRHPK